MTSFSSPSSRVIDPYHGSSRLIGIGLVFLLNAILAFVSMEYVPPGHVCVLTSFGRVTDQILPEGTHFVSPFKINHVMTVRTQSQEEHTSTPSSEGLNLEIDTSLIYHLNPDKAADVFKHLGSQYAGTLIEPTLRAAIRDTTAGHSANTRYSTQGKEAESQIKETLQASLGPRGIVIESILRRDSQP